MREVISSFENKLVSTHHMKKILSEKDRKYWENPTEHALMKEFDQNSGEFFSIFSRGNGKLMMLIDDDFQHAIELSQKMLESGVPVFGDMKELREWAEDK